MQHLGQGQIQEFEGKKRFGMWGIHKLLTKWKWAANLTNIPVCPPLLKVYISKSLIKIAVLRPLVGYTVV